MSSQFQSHTRLSRTQNHIGSGRGIKEVKVVVSYTYIVQNIYEEKQYDCILDFVFTMKEQRQ